MSAHVDHGDAWVCTDCYMAHHYGTTSQPTADGGTVWYAGESDTPCDREPLTRLVGLDAWDDTDSVTGDGMDDFSRSSCDGCGSPLGGSRFRLHLTADVA